MHPAGNVCTGTTLLTSIAHHFCFFWQENKLGNPTENINGGRLALIFYVKSTVCAKIFCYFTPFLSHSMLGFQIPTTIEGVGNKELFYW